MKNFTSEDIHQFINNFLLTHNALCDLSRLFNSGKVYISKNHKSPFSLVRLDEAYIPKKIPTEDMPSFFDKNRNNKKIYLLPNMIDSSDYSNTPEQKEALLDYVETIKEFVKVYITEEDSEEIKEKRNQLQEILNNKAKKLWNIITLQSTDMENLSNCLNPTFWQYVSNAHSYKNFVKEENKNQLTYNDLIKRIVESFENYDDVVQFEEFILKQSESNTRWNSNPCSEVQYEIWQKVLRKFVPINSLKTPSLILKAYYDSLISKKAGNNSNVLKRLKLLQFCDYDIVKDVYKMYYNKPETAAIADFTKKIIEAHDKEKNEDESIFSKTTYVVYHHSETVLNYNFIKKITNHTDAVNRILNLIINTYNENEENINILKISLYDDGEKAHLYLDAYTEEKARSLESDIKKYIDLITGTDFLNPTNLKILQHKNYSYTPYDYDKSIHTPSMKDKLKKELKTLLMAQNLDRTLTKKENKKVNKI